MADWQDMEKYENEKQIIKDTIFYIYILYTSCRSVLYYSDIMFQVFSDIEFIVLLMNEY